MPDCMEVVEHGVEGAAYSYGDDGQFHPVMWCPCGYRTQPSWSWEETGIDLDEHLAEFDVG